jgi:competence protein ComEC
LALAEYVSDEIEDEDPKDRYKKIHEQCGVLRFMYGTKVKQILLTGDSDLAAWKDHITKFHKDRLASDVISPYYS